MAVAEVSRTFEPQDSSFISKLEYNRETDNLTVLFRSGTIWQYAGIPGNVWNQLLVAESVGNAFNLLVRGRYNAYKLHVV